MCSVCSTTHPPALLLVSVGRIGGGFRAGRAGHFRRGFAHRRIGRMRGFHRVGFFARVRHRRTHRHLLFRNYFRGTLGPCFAGRSTCMALNFALWHRTTNPMALGSTTRLLSFAMVGDCGVSNGCDSGHSPSAEPPVAGHARPVRGHHGPSSSWRWPWRHFPIQPPWLHSAISRCWPCECGS